MRTIALCLLLLGCPTEPLNDDDDDATEPVEETDALDLAAEVSQANVEATIRALEDMGTRYTFAPENQDAQDWITDEMADYGFVVERDPFTVGNAEAVNLIARQPGANNPERVWIYSAHYDSTSTSPDTYAPGADDNASGVAGVLEAARILAGHELNDSVWFVFTGAEEQGSLGSEHMAEWLLEQDVNVQGVIAPDMIGYWPLGDEDLVDILGDDESEHLVQSMAEVATALGIAHKTWIQHSYCYGDDHTNFQEAGFPSITPMDCVEAHNIPSSGEMTPHYHRISDTIDTIHLPFTTTVVGMIVASLADLAGVL
jgi:Zn-dependent M28 family amino/carboxypeptidase